MGATPSCTRAQSCNCVRSEQLCEQQLLPLIEGSPGRSSSSRDLKPPKTPKNIDSWDFNAFSLHPSQVNESALWILLQTCDDSSAPVIEKHSAFVSLVGEDYLPNPYHNRRHALDVMQTVWRLGRKMRWDRIYQVEERLALVVAALGHDMGHFGVTNAFLVEMRDELAIRYNDRSPLENMHCARLFNILSLDHANIFSHLSPEDFRNIRKLAIDSILHTDPVNHVRILEELGELYENNKQIFDAQGTSPGKPDQCEALEKFGDDVSELLCTNKTIVARTLLHGADLSNPCKPFHISAAWGKAIMDEFFNQGDQEKSLGVPVGMLNDRNKVSLPNSQLGFIQFMVVPLAVAYTKVFRSWVELGSMLVDTFSDWADVARREFGTDESSRVQAVRSILEPILAKAAATALEITDAPETAEEAELVEMADNIGDFTDFDLMPSKLSKAEDAQNSIMVREVRRWRDAGEQSNVGQSQHRELVLLYVMSDHGAVPVDKDIIMKFGQAPTHFGQPEDTTQVVSLSDGPVVSVSVAADNMRSSLDQADFDHLLTAMLEKQVGIEKEVVES